MQKLAIVLFFILFALSAEARKRKVYAYGDNIVEVNFGYTYTPHEVIPTLGFDYEFIPHPWLYIPTIAFDFVEGEVHTVLTLGVGYEF